MSLQKSIREPLVSFAVSVALKENGFNVGSYSVWDDTGKYKMTSDSFYRDKGITKLFNSSGFIEAPTQAVVQEWFKIIHKIYINALPFREEGTDGLCWYFSIVFDDDEKLDILCNEDDLGTSIDFYDTSEEAINECIIYLFQNYDVEKAPQ